MNTEKHKKSLAQEWQEGEESLAPTHSRSPRVLGSHIKIPKPIAHSTRPNLANQAASSPEAAEMREAAPPAKTKEKHSQAASWEHLTKLERLPQLRAPYPYKQSQGRRPGRGERPQTSLATGSHRPSGSSARAPRRPGARPGK